MEYNIEDMDFLFDKTLYKNKNIKDFEKKILKTKEQVKFHFVPSFLIRQHCPKEIFRLNLYSHKIDRVSQSDFINFIPKEEWMNKYFSIIEACIAEAEYELIVKNFIKNNKLKSDIDLLSNSDYGNEILEAVVFIIMRNMQFSNECEIYGEIDHKLKIIKSKKFRNNKSMWIEYILKCLLWFGRFSDLDIFIKEFKEVVGKQTFEENNEYTFLINNTKNDNWIDKYIIFYNYLLKKNEYFLVSSNPNLTSKMKMGFPMLEQPIGKWKFEAHLENIVLFKPIEFTTFYIQETPNSFIYLVQKEALPGIGMLYEKLKNEYNLYPLSNPAAVVSSVIRNSLFSDYDDLQNVYHTNGDYLELQAKNLFTERKKPFGYYRIKSDYEEEEYSEVEFDEYKVV